MQINKSKCMSVKSKKENTIQCNRNKKYGDYCGYHQNCSLRIDKFIKEGNLNNIISIEELRSSNNMAEINKDRIKLTLNHYNLSINGSKSVLLKRLINLYNNIIHYKKKKFLPYIIKIQKWYRKYNYKTMFGPNFLYPHKCNNITDPCTLEKPNYKFRFTYKDLDNNIYQFDVRSLNEIIENGDSKNPYNRIDIPIFIKHKVKKRISLLKNEKIIDDEINIDIYQLSLKDKVSNLFYIFHNEAGFHILDKWFWNLSLIKLIQFYREAQDIFLHRCEFTNEIQCKIAYPDGKVFIKPYPLIRKITYGQKKYLQALIINDLLKISTSNKTEKEWRITGINCMMTAFVIVSEEAQSTYPHMWQQPAFPLTI